ncbi:MAG: tRNA (adenosine(37)-N6)-threonylcarbamoyltransferase complex ATPase subunit type 1 TsaE [Chthoniobacterales bacterium]
METICETVEETIDAGRRMAPTLSRGDIISLEGELGAGKTHFVKGLAEGLGVSDLVSSPTFTVIHEYEGTAFPLYHMDLYRLESEEEARSLGMEDCFASGVTVIEWGDKFPALVPASAQHIRFRVLSETNRSLQFSVKQK